MADNDKAINSGHLIYVVDDDIVTTRMVAVNLATRGYRVAEFNTGAGVAAGVQRDAPDLVILDLLMPGLDGLEVARQIRQRSQVPILMLSVGDEIQAKLAALDLGADDYLTKPFRIEELIARVRAILRRAAKISPTPIDAPDSYRSQDLFIDLETTRAFKGSQPVKLTQKEWDLLRVLVKRAGRVVSQRQLLQEAWGPDYGNEGDYVRAYISRLRRKLEPDPRNPRYILLERGIGYRLALPG